MLSAGTVLVFFLAVVLQYLAKNMAQSMRMILSSMDTGLISEVVVVVDARGIFSLLHFVLELIKRNIFNNARNICLYNSES